MNDDLGQLLIIGFEPAEMTPSLRGLLIRIQPAGIILFARNVVSAGQTYRLLQDCQAYVSKPLLTCVDMEGGRVDRFRSESDLSRQPLRSLPPATAGCSADTAG